ncbi:hypothetical protein GJ496_011779 [Pomphorhynchus laevis]|nr:hypothetical protein GJ496_011779 [Pomphorhynchus laevis]
MSLPNKTSPANPLPTHILKSICSSISPFLTTLFNSSIRSRIFPSHWKSAIVRPLLKKQSLDPSLPSSYRPISLLPTLSKLLERLILIQINAYLSSSNMYPPFQFAFRSNHSTEITCIKVYHDLLISRDKALYGVLISLDLSSAFDIVDHSVLLSRLRYDYGFSSSSVA